MLFTGILEAKYRDMSMRTVLLFLGITSLGMVIAFFISFRLGSEHHPQDQDLEAGNGCHLFGQP
ncbi:MAG: hypothetical protein MZU95_00130 [Desulfomicrobium escambiense]|nr:hypothetical protein [Desulfomicrobium escambiense]